MVVDSCALVFRAHRAASAYKWRIGKDYPCLAMALVRDSTIMRVAWPDPSTKGQVAGFPTERTYHLVPRQVHRPELDAADRDGPEVSVTLTPDRP